MTPAQHKQYLIDSIAEMETFCEKLATKMETVTNDMSYNAMRKIYLNKKINIEDFKAALRNKYYSAIQ